MSGVVAVDGATNRDMEIELAPSLKLRLSSKNDAKEKVKEKSAKALLIKEEERETGLISGKVLSKYMMALGGAWVIGVLFLCYVMVEVMRLSTSWWLSIWTNETRPKSHGPLYYLYVYAVLSFCQGSVSLGNSFWLVFSSLAAAQCLHNGMLEVMLRAPMSFLHSNPIGRIMNHFAKDTGDIDRDVAVFAGMFLTSIFQLISTFLLIGFVNTISLWSILPLLVKFYYAREVKHLDSITQSPVYAQFAEALNGLAIIWAYKVYDRIAKMNGNTMDTNSCFTLVNISSYQWLSMRLEFLGALMI